MKNKEKQFMSTTEMQKETYRHKAVDELNKIKEKLREGEKTEEGEIKPNPNKEWRTVWKEREGTRSIESGWVEKEETPKIMMIRVQSLEEREDQRIIEFQERGRLLDEEYNDILRVHNVDQQRLNTVARECDQRPNREGLIEALVDQINFDSQMRKKYDDVYQKERNVRREVKSYFRETRTKLLQIPEEPPQPSRWTLKPDEPNRREEIKPAQHQAQRPQ